MRAEAATQNPHAAPLFELAQAAGVPVGYERSVKLRAGVAERDRFLLSLGEDALARWNAAQFADALMAAGFATLDTAEFHAAYETAAAAHLGFEGGAETRLKLYLEQPVEAAGESDLVHLAWKQTPGGAPTVDEYRLKTGPAGVLADFLAATAGGVGAAQAAQNLLNQGMRNSQSSAFCLHVVSRETGRSSFDLRLYDHGLTLAEAAPLLQPAAAELAPEALWTALLEEAGHAPLGHIASGRGADDAPFFTVYYGGRELRPGAVA